MKKKIFALLIALLLSIVVACDSNNSNSDVTSPEVTTPEATTPEVTTPEVTTPEVTTPEATTPEVTTPEVTTPDISSVLTVSEVLSLMEDYEIGETSDYEVSIYGLATSSSYDSKHDSYTLWLSDGYNDEAFKVYSAKLDYDITGNYEDEDALAGFYVTVKGYLKLYQDKAGNIFYETCFLYANDSPTGYETSPVILSVEGNGEDSELLDFSDLKSLTSKQKELFLAAVSKDYSNLNIYDVMTDTYFSYDANLYCQSFEYDGEYYEYYYKKSGNNYYTLEDGVWYDTIFDEYGDELPLTKELFEYYVFIPHFDLINVNNVLYSESNDLYVIDASYVDVSTFLNYWTLEDTVYENFYFEINSDGYFSLIGMTDIYYDVLYNDEAYLSDFGQVIINENDLGIEDTPNPDITTPEVTTPDVSTPEVTTPDVSTPVVTTPDVELGLEEGTIIDTNEDINKIDEYFMPSTGNVNVLVIPVSFSGYPATQNMLDIIEKGFFGTEEDTGWESLKTYYEKSSYNQLHISGTVTPWFTPKYSQNYYAKYFDEENYEYGSNIVMLEALEYFKNTYNYDEFDGDSDEAIDCVYMVYNVPIGGDGSDEEVETYWAYTYWQYDYEKQDYGTLATAYTYVWLGYEFFENSPEYNSEFVKINSETLIHETGHAMGLNDYYDYDDEDINNNDGGFGYADMMDGNIGDHHPYSKLLMGWVNPTVVDKSGIYELPSFTTTGNFILIPAGDSYDSIYSEYFIIDLFTMSGLNEATMPTFYNVDKNFAGVRVSHINANIYLESDGYYYFSNNNTDSKYKEIRFIEADYNGSKFDCDENLINNDEYTYTESDDFFRVGGPIFGQGNFANYKTYSNEQLPFTMEVIELTSSSAKVKIIFK